MSPRTTKANGASLTVNGCLCSRGTHSTEAGGQWESPAVQAECTACHSQQISDCLLGGEREQASSTQDQLAGRGKRGWKEQHSSLHQGRSHLRPLKAPSRLLATRKGWGDPDNSNSPEAYILLYSPLEWFTESASCPSNNLGPQWESIAQPSRWGPPFISSESLKVWLRALKLSFFWSQKLLSRQKKEAMSNWLGCVQVAQLEPSLMPKVSSFHESQLL